VGTTGPCTRRDDLEELLTPVSTGEILYAAPDQGHAKARARVRDLGSHVGFFTALDITPCAAACQRADLAFLFLKSMPGSRMPAIDIYEEEQEQEQDEDDYFDAGTVTFGSFFPFARTYRPY
jgi:hypothetical protein